nr:hypothetical protein Itr_chr09CG17880 [Ipomoea trifida]
MFGSDELVATRAEDVDDSRGPGTEELASPKAGSVRGRDGAPRDSFCRPGRNSRGMAFLGRSAPICSASEGRDALYFVDLVEDRASGRRRGAIADRLVAFVVIPSRRVLAVRVRHPNSYLSEGIGVQLGGVADLNYGTLSC